MSRAFIVATMALLVAILLAPPFIGWASKFNDRVTLPNGMHLERSFDFTQSGRHDLVSAHGHSILAKDVEFVCFDDRYAIIVAADAKNSGTFDAVLNTKLDASSIAPDDSGLRTRNGCNGYYTVMLGPNLLYDQARLPFLPSCSSVNLENPNLHTSSWRVRRCRPEFN